MNLRDARESDLPSLARLLLLVHQMHVEAQPEIYRHISPETAREFLAARLAEPAAYLRVAEVGSEVQGYCSAAIQSRPNLALFQPGALLYVNEIVVSPASRRQGVGRALIGDLQEFARQRNLAQITLDVACFNTAARAFFQSQGFDVLRERMAFAVGRSPRRRGAS